jgi:CcmD family protein
MRLIKTVLLITALWVISAPFVPFTAYEKMNCYAGAGINSEQVAAPGSGRGIPADKEQPTVDSWVLYRVMGVVLIIWVGLSLFLFRLDRRVTSLEKDLRHRG